MAFLRSWEQRKFSEGVSEIGDGLHGTPTYSDDGDVYFVNGNNLVGGGIIINSETKTVDESQRSLADKSLDDNTILMSINGTIGNLAYYSGEKLMLGKSAAYIKVSEFDKKFVYAYLQAPSVQAYFMDSLTGTTIKNLGLKAIREMRIIVPQDVEEQSKIGEYFSNLDNLITLHQRISYIKSLIYEAITFSWEQRKLSEVAEVIGGGTPSTSNSEYWDGDINWYAPAEIGEQIYVESSERKITKLGLEKSSAKILPAHKTVLFTSRAGIGNTAILRTPAATNQGFQSMVLHDDINTYFVFSMTDMIKAKAEKVASGSTFAEISGKMLGNLEFMFPSKQEQDKIGEYFEQLDNLITLHQCKCNMLKKYENLSIYNFIGVNTNSWEQRKFSEGVSEIGDGLHGTPTYSDDGDVYFVNGNNLVGGGIIINSETKTVDESQRSLADKSLDDNTILMSINGTIGNLAYYSGEKLMLGKSAAYIKVSEFDKKFVYAYLQAPSVQAYFMDSLTGTTIKNLGLKAIREMRIIVPQDVEEQSKIGEYFSNLDNLITLHQRMQRRWRCFICKIKLKTIYFMTITHIGFVFIRRGRLGRSP